MAPLILGYLPFFKIFFLLQKTYSEYIFLELLKMFAELPARLHLGVESKLSFGVR